MGSPSRFDRHVVGQDAGGQCIWGCVFSLEAQEEGVHRCARCTVDMAVVWAVKAGWVVEVESGLEVEWDIEAEWGAEVALGIEVVWANAIAAKGE